ncbi:hypothetical protein HanRHA438_Chr03g0132971 [Helianthus annuus]|nr:hypothetical protein HanRHA438_Chr03g0132971 [Helianthus annuus]
MILLSVIGDSELYLLACWDYSTIPCQNPERFCNMLLDLTIAICCITADIGATLACGTGACVVVVAAILKGCSGGLIYQEGHWMGPVEVVSFWICSALGFVQSQNNFQICGK